MNLLDRSIALEVVGWGGGSLGRGVRGVVSTCYPKLSTGEFGSRSFFIQSLSYLIQFGMK